MTPLINAAATAKNLRAALEALDSVTTAVVSRDYTAKAVGGDTKEGDVDLVFGSQKAECSSGETCFDLVSV